MRLNNLSITTQMVLSLVATTLVVIIFGTQFFIWYSLEHEKRTLLLESRLEANLIADLITAPLAFFDIAATDENLHSLQKNQDVLLAIVYTADGHSVASYNPHNLPIPSSVPQQKECIEKSGWFPWELGNLKITSDITQQNQKIGYLYIEKKTDRATDFILKLLRNVLLFSTVLIFIVYLSSRSLSKKILQPVLSLADVAKNVAETKDYSVRVSHDAKNEITSLYDAFNYLLADTESLTTHLESHVASRTQELNDSLETLKKTQTQLVQSEKMASLGNLVSGVAHEVNTPLGNAITGGSIIVRETKELLRQIDEGSLKKSFMEQKLHILDETADLLLKSINQAANLIRSFKRISVDQSVEDKREFNLYEYLEEILLTFHNKLKKIPVTITIEGNHDFIIKSYPGVYAQIIINFVQNSLLHAFSTITENATITISFTVQNENLVLTYSDNGTGMDEHMRKTAFEPFTTTKRNAGGTGLGLNIVYNLITQKLHGSVELDSEPSKGVKLTLTLPIESTSTNKES